jgi:GxxExxY protein
MNIYYLNFFFTSIPFTQFKRQKMTKKEVTQLSYAFVGFAITVHKVLGPGLLENVFEKCLKEELSFKGCQEETQKTFQIEYRNCIINSELRLDLLVNDTVIVEFKSIESILPIHEAQLLSNMKLMKKPQGLLINFFTHNITKSTKPFANEHFYALNES